MTEMHLGTRGMFHIICDLLSLSADNSYHIHGLKEVIKLKVHKDYNKCKVMKSVHEWLDFEKRKQTFDYEEPFINYKDEPTP